MKVPFSLLSVLVGAVMLGACSAPSDASTTSSPVPASTTANLTTAPAPAETVAPSIVRDGVCSDIGANADVWMLAAGRGHFGQPS